MSKFMSNGFLPWNLCIAQLPATRGRQYATEGGFLSAARLATDSLGNMTLTLTNVVSGSRIRIEEQVAGTLVDERTATGTTEVFTVPVYSGGNPSNDLRIKVRKGTSGPKYQPFETLAVAAIGTQSVYIAQVADAIA